MGRNRDGCPWPAAIAQVEAKEKSPRAWYGGAIGKIGFDGNLNTGLTLRTVRILDGMAEVRAGATLLFDSTPEAEEAETRVKASAFLEAVRSGVTGKSTAATPITPRGSAPKFCSWITTIRSSTRSPTTCGKPAQRSRPYVQVSTKACSIN